MNVSGRLGGHRNGWSRIATSLLLHHVVGGLKEDGEARPLSADVRGDVLRRMLDVDALRAKVEGLVIGVASCSS